MSVAQQIEVPQQMSRAVSSDGDSGCALDEYTWVPPGLTAQQVSAGIVIYDTIWIDIR